MGDDIIVAGTQNDIIDGGDGADNLTGGAGDDIYLFDTGDVDGNESITENVGEGTDVIKLSSTTDFTSMTVASFDEIEAINLGNNRFGTFTGAQLNGETIDLQETGTGISGITVNMASGGSGQDQSQTTSDSNQASQLGDIIAKAVQAELQNQKRSGGILNPYGVA